MDEDLEINTKKATAFLTSIILKINPREKRAKTVAHDMLISQFFLAKAKHGNQLAATLDFSDALTYYKTQWARKATTYKPQVSFQFRLIYNQPPQKLYHSLGIMDSNVYLGVPPMVVKKWFDMELFGSMYNTTVDYFSAFPEELNYTNNAGGKCLGSFFTDLQALKTHTKLLANPPFIEEFMELMVKEIETYFENHPHAYIVVTIPVWDSETQKALGIKNYNKPFKAYELLVQSKYLVEKAVLPKDTYKYYNYQTKTFSPTSWTHLLCLGNWPPDTIGDLINDWAAQA